jgi:hypothetical protein
MPLGGPRGIGGDVKVLTPTSITVVRFDGTATTFAITSSTNVTDLGHGASTASLALGESVRIILSSTDGTVAGSIHIVPANIAGRVSAIDGDTIALTGPHGQSGTIQVSAATIYAKFGGTASLSDVRVGSLVVAGGTFGSLPTTIDAATVGIGMPGPGSGPGPNNGSGLLAGPFARGPPGILDESRPHARGVATR